MKKPWIIILSIITVLVGLRLVLPYAIIKYVNKTLDNIPGYQGAIEDVDLNLYRGAYVIEHVEIRKLEGEVPRPFVKIDSIDLSIEWDALLDGAIVGKVQLRNAAKCNVIQCIWLKASHTEMIHPFSSLDIWTAQVLDL